MSITTWCHHCGANAVRKEYIFRAEHSYAQFYCGQCNRAWAEAAGERRSCPSSRGQLATGVVSRTGAAYTSMDGRLRSPFVEDGLYYHRTHESHLIPDDFKEAKTELATAQSSRMTGFRGTRARVRSGSNNNVPSGVPHLLADQQRLARLRDSLIDAAVTVSNDVVSSQPRAWVVREGRPALIFATDPNGRAVTPRGCACSHSCRH